MSKVMSRYNTRGMGGGGVDLTFQALDIDDDIGLLRKEYNK